MSTKLCRSIHDMAFVLTNNIDRNMLFYAFVGFIGGLVTGIAICDTLSMLQ